MLNKYLKKALILGGLLYASVACAGNTYELIFATDFIRHGDRTPLSIIPDASFKSEQKGGELTSKGMQQLYILGKSFRKTYIQNYGLLPARYSPDTMSVYSSDFDRTLMSAQSLLLGLYPLGTGPRLSSQSFALPQGYQPIPVHTTHAKNDELFARSTVDSKQFQELLNQYVYSQPFWKAKEQAFQPKLALWSKQTGYNMTHIRAMVPIGDVLYIRKLLKLKPPAGLAPKDAGEIISLAEWVVVNKFKPRPISEFMTKAFWLKLKRDMENAANSKEKTALKYALYLGHDSNILSIMSALGLPLSTQPPYAAHIRFELFKDRQEQFFVKISYNQVEQKLPGCEGLCSMEKFFKLINP